jgi:uncharacterized protein YoxC
VHAPLIQPPPPITPSVFAVVADVKHALKKVKAEQQQSSKEIEDLKAASTRILVSNQNELAGEVQRARSAIQGHLSKPLELSGVVKEIGKVTRQLEEEM